MPALNARVVCSLLVVLAASCGAVGAEEPPAARQLPALESFLVTQCLGDRSLVWISRSRQEHRALFTPAFYQKCNSGSAVFPVWPCCDEGKRHSIFRSRRELERHFDALLRDPALAKNLPQGRKWVDAYLETVDRAVDFDIETLVFSSTPYGPTGMASASLDLLERDGVLTARVRIRVPPPPLTPNTALFRFAFAVPRAAIERVDIVSEFPAVADLGVPASSERTASFRP
jgi:hypothetical protein